MNDNTALAHTAGDDQLEPRTNHLVRRGFDGVSLASENAATQALVAKATADIQARWVMAMRRPRDINDVRQALLKECRRRGFAQAAIYSVPRAQTQIRGLSIRFAEVAIRCMTNMSCEAQTIFDSDEERIVRVTATDFETNVTWPRDVTVKKTVERKFLKKGQTPIRERINSSGERVYVVEATDDDVATKEAALVSKAARTAILRLIPGNLQDEAFDLCEQIMKDQAAKDPDMEKNQVFDAFASLNVMPSALAEWLGHPIEQTTPAELLDLRKLFGALREGDISWQDALAAAEEQRKGSKERPSAPPLATGPTANTAPTPQRQPAPQQQQLQASATTSSGKATNALKDKLKTEPPKVTTVKPISHPDAEPPPDGMEQRACAMCGVTIQVPAGEPAGAKCEECRSI